MIKQLILFESMASVCQYSISCRIDKANHWTIKFWLKKKDTTESPMVAVKAKYKSVKYTNRHTLASARIAQSQMTYEIFFFVDLLMDHIAIGSN